MTFVQVLQDHFSDVFGKPDFHSGKGITRDDPGNQYRIQGAYSTPGKGLGYMSLPADVAHNYLLTRK